MVEPILPAVVTAAFKAAFPKALKLYQVAQAETARQAIAKQLSRGKYWAITEDKAAAAMWRYLRAATEGAARRNLDLLAEALVSGAVDPEFAPDEFKRQADRLESVNRKEIVVLAAYLRVNVMPAAPGEAALVTRHKAAVARAMDSGLFTHEEDVETCSSGLTRTGWLCPANGFGFSGYRLTSELLRLGALVDFDAAVARELDGSDQS
jgi:hypothetical protein